MSKHNCSSQIPYVNWISVCPNSDSSPTETVSLVEPPAQGILMTYLSRQHGFFDKNELSIFIFSLTTTNFLFKYEENDINLWLPRRVWKEIDC